MPAAAEATDDWREVFGWVMYAWACHGFETTVASVMFGPYVTELAQSAVGDNGRVFTARVLATVTAKSFFFYCVSLSVLLQLLLLPLMGVIADYSSLKKRLLGLSCLVGAGSTCLLFLVGGPLDFRWGGAIFVVANLTFGATTVLQNAFLPEIASAQSRDRVSSRGYALGYLGGGLLLAANLAFMAMARRMGLSSGLAVRLSLLSAGLWWFAFAGITFRRLRSRPSARRLERGQSPLRLAVAQLAATWSELGRLPHTRRFLTAYLLFNDGVQTVISVAAVFLAQELFVARGLAVDQTFLLGLMLMVQFLGFAGSLLFERVARVLGAKRALIVSLVLWSAAIVYGYGVMQTERQAWGMAAVIALVLGGAQALSRSLFSCMIPAGREAAFFSLYEVANSGTSWIGPLLFALVVSVSNSYRQALLSLIALFAAGTVLLVRTDTRRAIEQAGQATAAELPIAG